MILLLTIDFAGEIKPLSDQLEARFRTEVAVSPCEFDCCAFLDQQRNHVQLFRTGQRLEKDRPPSVCKVLAVTGLDLFIPVLTFVFGEARLNGQCAIVSSYRLDNRFYGLAQNPALLRERLLKEAVHELGHTFGLFHCHNPECVMRSSTYVEEIDYKSSRLCERCLDLLVKC